MSVAATAMIVNLGVQDFRVLAPGAGAPECLLVGGKRAAPGIEVFLGGAGLRGRAQSALRLLQSDYGKHRNAFRFPIFIPAFQKLLADAGGHIDRLVFVRTNQEGTVFSKEDTVAVAEVLREVVLREYPGRTGEVCFLDVEVSPHLLSCALPQITRGLSILVPAEITGRVYISMSSGIPAINYALLWHSLHAYGPRTTYYQVIEPPPDLQGTTSEDADVQLFPVKTFLNQLLPGESAI